MVFMNQQMMASNDRE